MYTTVGNHRTRHEELLLLFNILLSGHHCNKAASAYLAANLPHCQGSRYFWCSTVSAEGNKPFLCRQKIDRVAQEGARITEVAKINGGSAHLFSEKNRYHRGEGTTWCNRNRGPEGEIQLLGAVYSNWEYSEDGSSGSLIRVLINTIHGSPSTFGGSSSSPEGFLTTGELSLSLCSIIRVTCDHDDVRDLNPSRDCACDRVEDYYNS